MAAGGVLTYSGDNCLGKKQTEKVAIENEEKDQMLRHSISDFSTLTSISQVNQDGLELSLIKTMKNHGDREANLREREVVVHDLDTLVQQVECGNILVYGSCKLRAIDPYSGIDLLAVVPSFVTRDKFFKGFSSFLKSRSEVSELRVFPETFVPVIKFKFNGFNVNLTLCCLVEPLKIQEDLNKQVTKLDPRCFRSLNGYCSTLELLNEVPDKNKFELLLKIVKLWAKTTGIYGSRLGYLGGTSWAILVAKIILMEAAVGKPIVKLVLLFFEVFSTWPWPSPVYIKKPNHEWPSDLMPIITCGVPQMNSAFNITKENLALIQRKLTEAKEICESVIYGSNLWQNLFKPILPDFDCYIKITAQAENDLSLWSELVESRLNTVCVEVRTSSEVREIQLCSSVYCQYSEESQSWFLGCSFHEGGKRSKDEIIHEIFESPIRNLKEICTKSVRTISPYKTSDFEILWSWTISDKPKPQFSFTDRKISLSRWDNISGAVNNVDTPGESYKGDRKRGDRNRRNQRRGGEENRRHSGFGQNWKKDENLNENRGNSDANWRNTRSVDGESGRGKSFEICENYDSCNENHKFVEGLPWRTKKCISGKS